MLLNPAEKDDYDIITAMRGPDHDDDNDNEDGLKLKLLFTSVVREAVLRDDLMWTDEREGNYSHAYNGAIINTMSNARVHYEGEELRLPATRHYMHHMRSAFRALHKKLPTEGYAEYFNWALKFVEPSIYTAELDLSL